MMEKINYKVSCSSEYYDNGGVCRVGSINDRRIVFGYQGAIYNVAWSPMGNEYGRPDPNPFLKIMPDKHAISEIKLYRAYVVNDPRFRENMFITHIDCEYSNSKTETIATNIVIPFQEYIVIKINRKNIKFLQIFFKPQSTHGIGVATVSEIELYGILQSYLYRREDDSVYGIRK